MEVDSESSDDERRNPSVSATFKGAEEAGTRAARSKESTRRTVRESAKRVRDVVAAEAERLTLEEERRGGGKRRHMTSAESDESAPEEVSEPTEPFEKQRENLQQYPCSSDHPLVVLRIITPFPGQFQCNFCEDPSKRLQARNGSSSNIWTHLKQKHPSVAFAMSKLDPAKRAVRKQIQQDIKTFFPKVRSCVDADKTFLWMVVKSNMPLSIGNQEAFAEWSKSVGYQPMARNTLVGRLLALHETTMEKIKGVTKTWDMCSFTSDGWSSSCMKGFEGLQLHHLTPDFEFRSACINFDTITDADHIHPTSEQIAKYLVKSITAFTSEKAIVVGGVTDNAASDSKAVCDLFTEDWWFPCFAHTMQLAVRDVFPRKGEQVSRWRKIVIKVRESGLLGHCYRLSGAHPADAGTKLQLDVSTRFNSEVIMLKSLLKNVDRLNKAMEMAEERKVKLKENDAPLSPLSLMIDGAERLEITHYVAVLEPVMKCVTDATFLDPEVAPFVAANRDTVNSLQKMLVASGYSTSGHTTAATESSSQSSASLSSIFERRLSAGLESMQQGSCYDVEISTYRSLLLSYRGGEGGANVGTLSFWKKNKHACPALAHLARKLLCILATQTSCERLFSIAGLREAKLRRKMTESRLRALVMLRENARHGWG